MVVEWRYDLVEDWPVVKELLQRSRVESVSDDGMMVLRSPDGQPCLVTIPRESVTLFRRLAAIQWTDEESLQRGRS